MPDSENFIPYGRQEVDQEDIDAVVEVLKSDWLTTGPMVSRFEEAVAKYAGLDHAVAVSNGTAGLHAAMFVVGVGPGDEVILPPMTFVATANAVLYQGGIPVFSDVRGTDLLIDPLQIEEKITSRTKAIIAVDYAGQPCDYDALQDLCQRYDLALIADACHSLGATYGGSPVGRHADLTVFSFHPVKPLTTAEGGMVLTGDAQLAERMRRFRSHGVDTDFQQRLQQGAWHYDMVDLGYNYRLSDIQCALGLSQLRKLSGWIARRQYLAEYYSNALSCIEGLTPLQCHPDRGHGYHLYVVRVANGERDALFKFLRERQIGVNVHYRPVYHHSFYRDYFQRGGQSCPQAEDAFREILTLPLFPGMDESDIDRIVSGIQLFYQ